MLLGDQLVNCTCPCDLQVGRGRDEKHDFWDLLFSMVGKVHSSEMTIVGRDFLICHVSASVEWYE